MRIPHSLGLALSASAAVAVLAACSGAGQQSLSLPMQSQSQQSVLRGSMITADPVADASTTVAGGLYVAQMTENFVREYTLPNKGNMAPRCTDTFAQTDVNGIGVNAKRVLYVPDGGARKILTFAPNCGAAGPTLIASHGRPTDVAFDNTANNTVYVADSSTNCIDVYDKGATLPTRTLCNAAIKGSLGDAVDAQGNVYQSGVSSANIARYLKGQQTGSTILGLTGLKNPVGLEFDTKGNLIVIDSSNGILIYAPPYKGAPTKRISTKGSSFYGKLDAANLNLYVGDFTFGSADVYSYPSGTFEYSITNGLNLNNGITGVAVDPPSAN